MRSTGIAALLDTALAPPTAMGLTAVVMANSLGLAMENAVAAQQRGQVVAAAATTQTLVLIIAKGAEPCPPKPPA